MPNVFEFSAAVGASAVAVFLGLAFWPQIQNSATPGRPAVSQPIFVASAAATKPLPSEAPVAPAATTSASAASAPAGAVADAAALAKLAMALQANPPTGSIAPVATRSLSLAAAVPLAPHASDAARQLCAQGLVALAAGDIAGARLYLERAAEGGDARALLVLGETYDPAALARMGALGVKGEALKARDYYAKALAAGMGAARERIAALEAQ